MPVCKRDKIVAGNWKMNKTPSQTRSFIQQLDPMLEGVKGCRVVLCVPFVDIPAAAEKAGQYSIGAQNMHFEKAGAYTGEISAEMLTDLGVEYVIIGHSERRRDCAESDVSVNKKIIAVFENGMTPILCVGESQEQRDRGVAEEFIGLQIREALCGLTEELAGRLVIAYEPIWAIGTGKTASAKDAQDMCALIRAKVRQLYGDKTAESTHILYGGSMNGRNAPELLACPDIDGGLIGGASLNPEDFIKIVRSAAL